MNNSNTSFSYCKLRSMASIDKLKSQDLVRRHLLRRRHLHRTSTGEGDDKRLTKLRISGATGAAWELEGFSFSHWCWRFLFQPACGCLKRSSRSSNKRLVSTPEIPQSNTWDADRPASQEQRPPAGSKERSPTASPSEQTPVPPPPAKPESRTAAIKPGLEIRPAEASAKLPPATVEIAPPMKVASAEDRGA